ncbi:hypothetical protein F2Q70_00020436 [Brassica cretica]|uniref:Uncharacterized protein n=1 Tax=Brassica cretica TaxID=69181 RepID=A0A8S9GNS1_BRACR|nr:hypothetical protein F2Q70_00020436 [Brassica cretica]
MMTTYNTPMYLLSMTEDVTRTFVPGEQLKSQHRERQRIGGRDGCSGLGGMSNYQSKVTFATGKSNSFSPSWWRSWSSTAFVRRKGTCDDVQLGSWNREGIQYKKNETELAEAIGASLLQSIGGYMSMDMFIKTMASKNSKAKASLSPHVFYDDVVPEICIDTLCPLRCMTTLLRMEHEEASRP